MNKEYMHNQISFLENKVHSLNYDFKIKADQLISTRRPDLVIVNKKDMFVYFLLHISLSRLFNAKSIFIQIFFEQFS